MQKVGRRLLFNDFQGKSRRYRRFRLYAGTKPGDAWISSVKVAIEMQFEF
jgi:hypothetical protein